MSTLPAPAPMVTTTTQEFWDATARGEFRLQRCDDCGTVIWFPRSECPECWTSNLTVFNATGRGTVYSYTIIRKGAGDYQDKGPFVVAYVELEEGPRVLTNVVDCDVESVRIGMPVTVVWHDTGKGNSLYRFRPAD